MKIVRLISAFIIFYFGITAFNAMITLAKWLSFGNQWIELGFYVFMVLLFLVYIVYPLIRYTRKPSLKEAEKVFNGDKKATKKIYRYLMKVLDNDEKEVLKGFALEENDQLQLFIKEYIKTQSKLMDKTIQKFALKLTVTVMISPNSFIDGISILYGNSQMIYTLTKAVHFRFGIKDLLQMYFSVMNMASVSGIVEEFDEMIEEVIEEVAEEFAEFMTEESTKSISDSVPFFNVAMKAISPIIQASGNYAFIVFNGNRFKYKVLNIVKNEKLLEQGIEKLARKDARKAKYEYIRDMVKKVSVNNVSKFKEAGASGVDKVKEASASGVDKVNKVKEVSSNSIEKVKDASINSVDKMKKGINNIFN